MMQPGIEPRSPGLLANNLHKHIACRFGQFLEEVLYKTAIAGPLSKKGEQDVLEK